MDLLSTAPDLKKKKLLIAPEKEGIPDDVVEDILVWLPVKTLNRFRCVSRSLSSKIANPEFITKHFNLSSSNNNGYLLCKSPGRRELCTVVWNSNRSLTVISRFQIPFLSDILIGFCNGILCYTLFREPCFPRCRFPLRLCSVPYFPAGNPKICLWDPSIGKLKIIEPEDKGFVSDAYGFEFHSQNNDFKFLRFRRFIKDGVPSSEGRLVQVYTLSINSWSWLELQDITHIETSPCLFFNGALHYIAYSQNRKLKLILCFDVHDHNFREILLPHGYSNGLSLKFERLAVFKGSLALIAFGQDEDYIELCHIWAMREYRLVSSWTQTNVVPLPDVDIFFGCTGSGKLVFTRSTTQLFSFDPDSQNENNLGIEDLAPVKGLKPLGCTPKLIESLFLLNE